MHVGGEEVLNSRKGPAQLVEQLAQVIASLGLGGIGPEKEGQVLALLRRIAMQHKVGQQGLQAHTVEIGHLFVIVDQAEPAEQAHLKGWFHRNLLASPMAVEMQRTERQYI
jgi:hypothetical protein